MSKEVFALVLTMVVHVLGVGALIWLLVANDGGRPDWRSWWPGDDGGDAPRPQAPEPHRPGGLPLPDAAPSAVRLREPAWLADGYPAPERRPAHAPERVPQPAPDR